METTVDDCELYEVGQFDMSPGAHFQMADGRLLCLEGLSQDFTRQLGALLYEKVRVRIIVTRIPPSTSSGDSNG